MADPQIGQVVIEEMRYVTLALGTEMAHGSVGGGRFRPDRLKITYKNGTPQHAVLHGPMIRADGNPYMDGRRGRWIHDTEGDATPAWIKGLVQKYRPAN